MQSLRKLPGVRIARIDFLSGKAALTTNGRVSRRDVAAAIKRAGFTLQFPVARQGPPPGKASASKQKQGAGKRAAGPGNVAFTLYGMTCDACARSAEKALSKVPGVLGAQVDFRTRKVNLRTDTPVARERLREALKPFGYEARFPGEAPPPAALSDAEKKGLDIQTVSHGEKIRIERHLARGKYTLFDFHADWCGPCLILGPKLERLVRDRRDVALRKVNLLDWKSPAALQAVRSFRLPSLPYVLVYGPRGRLLGAVTGNQIEQIEKLIPRKEARPEAKKK